MKINIEKEMEQGSASWKREKNISHYVVISCFLVRKFH